MIYSVSRNNAIAIAFSVLLLGVFLFLQGEFNLNLVIKYGLILCSGILMNALCSRFDILGKKTSLPLVIFCLLSVFLIPNLSYADLVYCAVWLVVFFLAFNRGESQSKSINYMIYLGITLGIAQTVENTSVLLLVPTFILFSQTGPINARAYVTCFLYFFMVLLGYSGILYVMELDENLYT